MTQKNGTHGLGVGLFICRPEHELKIGWRLTTDIIPIETYRGGKMGFCFLNNNGKKDYTENDLKVI